MGNSSSRLMGVACAGLVVQPGRRCIEMRVVLIEGWALFSALCGLLLNQRALDPRTLRASLKLLETVKPQIALLRARLARRAAPLPLLEHPRLLNQRRVGDQT